MEGKVLEVNNLTKTYGSKGFQTKVMKGISLSICERDFIAIMGPRGSGICCRPLISRRMVR